MYTIEELAEELNRKEWAVETMLKNRGYLKQNGEPRKSTIDDGLMNKNGLIKEAGWSAFIDELGYKKSEEDDEEIEENNEYDEDYNEEDDSDEEYIENEDECLPSYLWYGSSPLELDLYLYEGEPFFRPKGKLVWGTPEYAQTWEDFMKSIPLEDGDPFIDEIINRTQYGYKFSVLDSDRILNINEYSDLPDEYIFGKGPFSDGNNEYDSYIIDFSRIKEDGYAGIEISFDVFPPEYMPWSFTQIVIWDSSVITNVKRIK